MRRFALPYILVLTTVLISSSLSAQVAVTVTSNVNAQPFTVAGAGCSAGNYTVPHTLQWSPDASCTVAFSNPYSAQSGARYLFSAWQDMETSNPRTFGAPAQAATLTATFMAQYYLTVYGSPSQGGTTTGEGWYDAGSQATISATPATGYQFISWSTVVTANPATLIVKFPQTVVAYFGPITTPTPNHYTVIAVADEAYLFGQNTMNDYGQAVGRTSNGTFLWTPSSANGVLGSPQSLPGQSYEVAINSLGEVAAGTSGGLRLLLPTTPNAATFTQTVLPLGSVFVSALNAFGQVAGQFNGRPGIWTPDSPNGTTGTLTLNDQFYGLAAMNRFGQAIMNPNQGNGQPQGVLFTPSSPNSGTGTFTPIPGPPGGSRLVAINDNGTILGYSCFAGSSQCLNQGFLWTPDSPNSNSGTVTDIPSLPGTAMVPTAMNAQGDVVGMISYGSGGFPFLYTGGMVYDLSGWLTAAGFPQAINSSGQIAADVNGAGADYHGYQGVVLATPAPAPEAPPPDAVSVTIASSVPGQPFTVAGKGCSAGAYTGKQTLQWTPDATCVVAFGTPYSTQVTKRYVFSAWQDGVTSNPRSFTAPSQAATYTANFTTQYLITGHASIPGTGKVTGGGWYNENAIVTLTAEPAPGYVFVRWEGGTAGMTGPLSFTVSYAADPVADFAIAPAPGNYTSTLITEESYGAYLNDYGQVAGMNDVNTVASPYLWTPLTPNGALGNLTAVSPPPSPGSWNAVWGLNNQGQVLGTTQTQISSLREVFLWTPTSPNSPEGAAVAISSLNPAPFAIPALSNYGEVVGSLNGSWGIWTPGAANGTTGTITSKAAFTGAAAINSVGQIIVNQSQSDSSTLPVLFTPSSPRSGAGTFTAIPGLSGYSSTKLTAINDNGTIAGFSCTASSYPPSCQGFIWTPDAANGTSGDTVPIPLSAGVLSVQPSALNKLGDVVGTMTTPNPGGGTPVPTPFLFTKGALYDLSHLNGVPQYSSAVAINAAGQILFSSGYDAIYLATPTPPTIPPPKNAVPVTVTSSPSGQAFAVTGTGCTAGSYSTPQTLQWTPASNCVVAFLSPYSNFAQTRTIFTSWQDANSSNPRTLTTPTAATTYTANFATEYYLTAEANIPNVGPIEGSGWYAADGTATLTSNAVPGYKFVNWYGDYRNQGSPLVVTMDHPKTVIANYVPVANVASGSYSITTIAGKGFAAGMNEFGQVAGTVAGVPFLWTPDSPNGTLGTLVDLADFANSGPPVSGVAINDVGQVIALGTRNSAAYDAIFLWSPDSPNSSTGILAELPLYFREDLLSPGVSFNNYGQIGDGHGAIWTPTVPNGATGSLIADTRWAYLKLLNGFGQGVMSYYPGATPVLFTPSTANGSTGTFTRLPALVSTQIGASAFAAAISEDGAVVGYTSCDANVNCGYEGFLWKPDAPHGMPGTLTLIPPFPGFSSLVPKAMNSKGDIVGDMAGVPFLYTGGALYALTALNDFDSAASLVAINSAGEILFNSPSGAYLGIPATRQEPPSNAALVTISANVDVSFSVKGDGCSAGVYPQPQTLKWSPGASCTVAFLSPDTTLDSRIVFNGWQDGNTSNPRIFTAPSQATIYTASFKHQVYVAALVQPVGSGTVAGEGWYDEKSTVTLTAIPATGYAFLKWTSASASFTDNPLTVTANSPQTFTAIFTTVTIPIPGNYSVTLIAQSGTGIGINDFGQVAGFFDFLGTFLWTPSSPNGVLGSLDMIPGMNTPGGLNSMGQVAGFANQTHEVLLWSPTAANTGAGTVASIASSYGYVTALNDFGQIAGSWSGGFSIWTPDQANGPTGTTVSDARFFGLVAMNSYGQAIMNGGSTSKTSPTWVPLLFTPASANGGSGTFTSVPGPDGLVEVTLKAIGPEGTILGYGCVPLAGFCLNQGFFWIPDAANASTGNAMSIPLPGNIAAMTPVAMNAGRDVIGTMQEATGGVAPFLYEQGLVYDLTPLIGHGTLVAINNAGQILFNATGNFYVATPVRP